MASQSPLLSHLLLFLVIVLFLFLSASTLRCLGSALGSSDGSGAAASAGEMRPAAAEAWAAAPSIAAMVAARRRLGSFQICAPCTCCGGPKGLCLLSPCCYAINCNLPNRPFGFCSFTPNSCDCLACNLD